MLLTKAATNIYFHLVSQLVQVGPPVFHMHYLLTYFMMDVTICFTSCGISVFERFIFHPCVCEAFFSNPVTSTAHSQDAISIC